MRQRGLVTLAVVLLVALLVGCSFGTWRPTTAPTPPPTPTPTLPPPLQAGPVADWDGASVKTACLTVDYAGPSDFSTLTDQWLRSILQPVGVSLVAPADQCDATLVATIEFAPAGADYIGAGYCFTGGEFAVTLALNAPSRPALVYHDEMTLTPPMSIIGDCSAETAAQAADHRDWYAAGHLLRGTTRLWGPVVALEALRGLPDGWPAPRVGGVYLYPELLPEGILTEAAAGQSQAAAAGPGLGAYQAWRAWHETQTAPAARPLPTITSRADPVALGDLAVTPDGWSIQVTDVQVVRPEGAPRNERQVTLSMSATWVGFGRVDPLDGDGFFGFFRPTVDEPGWCETPDPTLRSDIDAVRGLYRGETVTGWAACWEVPDNAVDELAAHYEPIATSVYGSPEGEDNWVWFALR